MAEETTAPESYSYNAYILAMYADEEQRDETLWTGNFTGDVLPF